MALSPEVKKRVSRPSETDLWLYANRSYAFLRDEEMKMQLYFHGNGKMEVVPCSRIKSEAEATRFHCLKRFYSVLLKKYGYKK